MIPEMMYWESPLKAQSHTQRCFSVVSSATWVKSTVFQIFTVASAELVANNLGKAHGQSYSTKYMSVIVSIHRQQSLICAYMGSMWPSGSGTGLEI